MSDIFDDLIRESASDSDDKAELLSIYSDVYKEKYGIRPRDPKVFEMTPEQIKSELERLYAEPSMDDMEPESSGQRDPPPEWDYMVDIDPDFGAWETLPTRAGMGRRPIGENVVDFGAHKKKRDVETYEKVIGPFIATSQSGVEKLQFAKEFFDAQESKDFDEILGAYRRAASDLSAFLRAKRLRMRG